MLTWRKWLAPNNASRQQMGFNSGFKGLTTFKRTFPHCHQYSKSTLLFGNVVFVTYVCGEGMVLCDVRYIPQVKLLSDVRVSLCYSDCKCLHRLLTGYKQGYADFWICEDGIMSSVAPHVRFECNFNLEERNFPA